MQSFITFTSHMQMMGATVFSALDAESEKSGQKLQAISLFNPNPVTFDKWSVNETNPTRAECSRSVLRLKIIQENAALRPVLATAGRTLARTFAHRDMSVQAVHLSKA